MKFTRNRWSQRLIRRMNAIHGMIYANSLTLKMPSLRSVILFQQIPNGDFRFTPGAEAKRFQFEMAKVNGMATSSAKQFPRDTHSHTQNENYH